jgi:hypothetical protein
VTVVSGLRNKGGESSSPHGIIEETWLSCVSPRLRNAKTGVGVTVDQIAARHLGKDTPLPSLELCGEPGGMISFRTPDQPLPMESNPRKAFYGMFGQGDSAQEREAILNTTSSLLDYVRESAASLNRWLDAGDRARVSDYLESVREIERRVQKLEENARSLRDDLPGAPLGPPEDFGELLDIQFEMVALSWQTNRTRVATLKMVEEASMRTYPNLDVHEAFHPTSHWGGFPDRIANLRKIQNYHTAVFAKFVKRLAGMRDGDGSVLDHSLVLFGSNMANSDAHNNDPLPQALIGRGGGVKGNQHLHFPQDTPHANILVTMLHRAGVPAADIEVRGHRRVPGSVIQGSGFGVRGRGCSAGRAVLRLAHRRRDGRLLARLKRRNHPPPGKGSARGPTRGSGAGTRTAARRCVSATPGACSRRRTSRSRMTTAPRR